MSPRPRHLAESCSCSGDDGVDDGGDVGDDGDDGDDGGGEDHLAESCSCSHFSSQTLELDSSSCWRACAGCTWSGTSPACATSGPSSSATWRHLIHLAARSPQGWTGTKWTWSASLPDSRDFPGLTLLDYLACCLRVSLAPREGHSGSPPAAAGRPSPSCPQRTRSRSSAPSPP